MLQTTTTTPDQQYTYLYATREDGEAHGPHGVVVPFSLFRSQKQRQNLTLPMLPGTAHTKAHFEAPAWIDGFARQGLDVLTLSYDRRARALQDYVRHVYLALRATGIHPTRAIPVGHSLGGAVDQLVASRAALAEAGFGSANFAGIVVLAALAPELWMRAYLPTILPLWLRHPRLARRINADPSLLFSTPALARQYLFQSSTPGEVVEKCRSLMCPESGQAALSILRAKTAPLAASRALFICGANDAIVPSRLVARTTERYQALGCKAEFLLLPATPHNLMHDGESERVIDAIGVFARACAREVASRC